MTNWHLARWVLFLPIRKFVYLEAARIGDCHRSLDCLGDDPECVFNPTTDGGVIVRALDPNVMDTVWAAIEPLLPERVDSHPLGRHRRRVADRVCFEGIMIRLVTGCSWEDTERLLRREVSDTTLRSRRDEWIAAGVFDALVTEAVSAYDRIIGLDLSEVVIDTTAGKAPCGGEGTGRNPMDKGKLGVKWSIVTDANGLPLGWVTDAANRHDVTLLEPTLAELIESGLIPDVETLHLDKGYDSNNARAMITGIGIRDAVIPRRLLGNNPPPAPYRIDWRWVIERTNSWITNYGQLRRNTDRRIIHRLAQFALAITCLITAKLIDWNNRWINPNPSPIR